MLIERTQIRKYENKWILRLFSIFLMLTLIFITLSTATYAWFSSNNYVNLTDIEFTASSNKTGTSDLLISWDKNDRNSYSITFKNIDNMQPMIPVNAGIIDETEYETFCNFNKATQIYNNLLDKIIIKLSENQFCRPYNLTSENNENIFYLINTSQNDMLVYIDYSLSGDAALDNFKCAFFTEGILRGIMTTSSIIHYGLLQNGDVISNINVMENVYCESGQLYFYVPGNYYVECKAVVWFDGVFMTDNNANNKITLNMSFNGQIY